MNSANNLRRVPDHSERYFRRFLSQVGNSALYAVVVDTRSLFWFQRSQRLKNVQKAPISFPQVMNMVNASMTYSGYNLFPRPNSCYTSIENILQDLVPRVKS